MDPDFWVSGRPSFEFAFNPVNFSARVLWIEIVAGDDTPGAKGAEPPIGPERVAELGSWTERLIGVSGASWDVNSVDIAVSGLGWYSLGLKGTATVALWTLEGIHVTERDAMILHRAQFLERPGFWLPIAIANAIGEETRKKNEKRKAEQRRREDLLLEEDLILEESTY